MRALVEAVGFGVASGALIALGAVGFTVQFAISGYFNVAYGALLTEGAFIGYALLQVGLSPGVALVVAPVAVAITTLALNRCVISPFQRRGAGPITVILATASVALIVQYVVAAIAGPYAVSYGSLYGTTVNAWWLTFTSGQLGLIGVSVALMVGLHLLLTRTRLGRAMRATAGNRTLAQACGIRTARVIDVAWLLSGAVCGVAGVALALTTVSFDFNSGSTFMIYMLAAACLGGLGQPYGAMAGGLAVGIISQIAATEINPAFQNVAAFSLLVLILVGRPTGLFSGGSGGLRALSG